MTTLHEELEREIGKERTLVVNSTMEVKEIVPWTDAMTMLVNEKAFELIGRADGSVVHTPSTTFSKPLVVGLVKYAKVHRKVFDLEDAVTKAYVRQRDNYTCAYCGEYGNTVDHIFPYSRGGKNSWGNLVTACRSCNGKKADRTPAEAGMREPVISTAFTLSTKLQTVQDLLYKVLEETSV